MNTGFKLRKARLEDLPQIVELLVRDPLGSQRETLQVPLPPSYYEAFSEIDADQNNELLVLEDRNKIIGTAQLTFIPSLTYQGGKRAQIEGVRIDEAYRGQGLGKLMLEALIQKARERGCRLIQLTMDKKRQETIEFYEKLGFIASHEGLKQPL